MVEDEGRVHPGGCQTTQLRRRQPQNPAVNVMVTKFHDNASRIKLLPSPNNGLYSGVCKIPIIMSSELIVGWVALVIAGIGVGISVWALLDVRAQVKELISVERQRVFTKVRNDMVWLFIDPTERSHTPEIAKGLEDFALLSRVLDPAATPELTNHAVNNLALLFADQLVTAGFATWKSGWDHDKLKHAMQAWQTAVNANRIENIFGKEKHHKSLG